MLIRRPPASTRLVGRPIDQNHAVKSRRLSHAESDNRPPSDHPSHSSELRYRGILHNATLANLTQRNMAFALLLDPGLETFTGSGTADLEDKRRYSNLAD